jgi:hypothetical protein
MRSHLLSLAAVLALAPAALLAQDSTSASAGPGAGRAALDQALEVGIPRPAQPEDRRGKAKGVPMDRIAAAVEKRLEALTRHARR